MATKAPGISLIIPVLNEREALKHLLARIHSTLSSLSDPYEIIAVDDHSADGSWEQLQLLSAQYPALQIFRKKGKQGKAESLREGFARARYDAIAFIDADLQYPPEALRDMYTRLSTADAVVSQRVQWKNIPKMRQLSSRVFNIAIGRLLFGLPFDTQSGMKMFRASLLPLALAPSESWSFDIPFIWHATCLGKKIVSHPITFSDRTQGTSKIRFLSTGLQLMTSAILLRLQGLPPLPFKDNAFPGKIGSGIMYRNQKFVTHTDLDIRHSALQTLTGMQKLTIAASLIIICAGFFISWSLMLLLLVSLLTLLYLADAIFTFILTIRSFVRSPEITISARDIAQLQNDELPTYSILCPLYKEAVILPQFIRALKDLDWPDDKLDVQLLLEESDEITRQEAARLQLPNWIRLTIVPDSQPRTKPKACNYGLAHARGEYVVIYDAEDIPQPDQLKKVYLAFKHSSPRVVCMQAKLGYYNATQNILTRLFAAEYHLWFGLILPGLQSLNALIPLGGTSNHFRRQALDALHGWDPFNVTEDCDLGIRLFQAGYQTAIVDSITFEEANSQSMNWLRQRSRWIKGYMQSYLVVLRAPREIIMHGGIRKMLYFHLTVGSKVFSLFWNPMFWFMTIGYFVAQPYFKPVIDVVYPMPLPYIGGISLVMGNFLYFYSHMLAVAKSEEWWLVKYTLLVPVYWLFMSVASWYAFWQLITRPHYWEKTIHGLHIHPSAKPLIAAPAEFEKQKV